MSNSMSVSTSASPSLASESGWTRLGRDSKLTRVSRVPCGLATIVNGLVREILRENPEDLYSFAARHFDMLLQSREGPVSLACSRPRGHTNRTVPVSHPIQPNHSMHPSSQDRTKLTNPTVDRSGWSIREASKVLKRQRIAANRNGPGITSRKDEKGQSLNSRTSSTDTKTQAAANHVESSCDLLPDTRAKSEKNSDSEMVVLPAVSRASSSKLGKSESIDNDSSQIFTLPPISPDNEVGETERLAKRKNRWSRRSLPTLFNTGSNEGASVSTTVDYRRPSSCRMDRAKERVFRSDSFDRHLREFSKPVEVKVETGSVHDECTRPPSLADETENKRSVPDNSETLATPKLNGNLQPIASPELETSETDASRSTSTKTKTSIGSEDSSPGENVPLEKPDRQETGSYSTDLRNKLAELEAVEKNIERALQVSVDDSDLFVSTPGNEGAMERSEEKNTEENDIEEESQLPGIEVSRNDEQSLLDAITESSPSASDIPGTVVPSDVLDTTQYDTDPHLDENDAVNDDDNPDWVESGMRQAFGEPISVENPRLRSRGVDFFDRKRAEMEDTDLTFSSIPAISHSELDNIREEAAEELEEEVLEETEKDISGRSTTLVASAREKQKHTLLPLERIAENEEIRDSKDIAIDSEQETGTEYSQTDLNVENTSTARNEQTHSASLPSSSSSTSSERVSEQEIPEKNSELVTQAITQTSSVGVCNLEEEIAEELIKNDREGLKDDKQDAPGMDENAVCHEMAYSSSQNTQDQSKSGSQEGQSPRPKTADSTLRDNKVMVVEGTTSCPELLEDECANQRNPQMDLNYVDRDDHSHDTRLENTGLFHTGEFHDSVSASAVQLLHPQVQHSQPPQLAKTLEECLSDDASDIPDDDGYPRIDEESVSAVDSIAELNNRENNPTDLISLSSLTSTIRPILVLDNIPPEQQEMRELQELRQLREFWGNLMQNESFVLNPISWTLLPSRSHSVPFPHGTVAEQNYNTVDFLVKNLREKSSVVIEEVPNCNEPAAVAAAATDTVTALEEEEQDPLVLSEPSDPLEVTVVDQSSASDNQKSITPEITSEITPESNQSLHHLEKEGERG